MMRYATLMWLVASMLTPVQADDPHSPTWEAPFSAISSSESESPLVILVITNDDPLSHRRTVSTDRRQPAVDKPAIWCGQIIQQDLRSMLRKRPDLRSRIKLQALAAGLPIELTNGVPRHQPSRSVVLVCDGRYRLLGMTVGVPDTGQLRALIEDAEEVHRLITLDQERSRQQLVAMLADRNQERLTRMWQNVLSEMRQGFAADDATDLSATSIVSSRDEVFQLTDALQSAYEVDSRLRFGLKDQLDRQRLTVLEQHPETREHWCNTLTPFIAGINAEDHWRELVESIWGLPPITANLDITELKKWTQDQTSSDLVIFTIQSPRQLEGTWPPSREAKAGKSWNELHEKLSLYPSRPIDLESLANLIQAMELQPIDAFRPVMGRYVVLERDSNPLVIRATDPPGRLAGFLRRSKLEID